MDSIGDIRNQDTSKVSYLLVNSGYFDNMELLENNLREIKVILKAIHELTIKMN